MHCMTRISQQECRGILELREYTFSLGIGEDSRKLKRKREGAIYI